MKKQAYKQNKKTEKKPRRKSVGAIRIFMLTLGVFLLLGLLLLFGMKTVKNRKQTADMQTGVAETANDTLLDRAFGRIFGSVFTEASNQTFNQTSDQASGEVPDQEKAGASWEKIPEESTDKKAKEDLQTGLQQGEEEARYAKVLNDPEYMKANRIIPWETDDKEVVTLGFVGDILFDDEYAIMANLINRGGTIEKGISQELLSKMQEVDILIANNEFPYTRRGTPTEGKTYTFRADPDTVAYLHDMGVDVAVLANNHIFDFGEEGLLDSLDTLTAAGIPYIGAGRDLKEASAPLYFIANDIKIAVVAATQIERLDSPDTRGAGENISGVFRCLNPEKLYEVVAEAKENSDFVIVYIHWGTENVAEPDWAQLEQGAGLAEAGADLVIGAHPHCLQGITYQGETPVIYSLGNFWFNSRTVDTGMLQAEITKDGLKSIRFLPAIQSDCRVKLADETESKRILSYISELSPGVQIDAQGYVSRSGG